VKLVAKQIEDEHEDEDDDEEDHIAAVIIRISYS
jgi:hypothetical protein